MEKNELPQTVKLVYNAELNCMVDVADNRYVQGIDSGVEYRKVGEKIIDVDDIHKLTYEQKVNLLWESMQASGITEKEIAEGIKNGYIQDGINKIITLLGGKVGEGESIINFKEKIMEWLTEWGNSRRPKKCIHFYLADRIDETYQLHRKEGK